MFLSTYAALLRRQVFIVPPTKLPYAQNLGVHPSNFLKVDALYGFPYLCGNF